MDIRERYPDLARAYRIIARELKRGLAEKDRAAAEARLTRAGGRPRGKRAR
jgi:hypothetical protein